jgi:N utilization substance protein A
MPWREQIPGEHYYTGKRIRVYLDTVEQTGKGPQLRISRTHPNLVKKLLELEIPEVRNEDVEIRAIARDAGFRSKVAVSSNSPTIDPIGACVGQKGVRIQAVMDEINGERVDMIEWSDDPIKLISTALQPAAISAVIIVNDTEHLDEEDRKVKKRAAVFVEEAQRPMAIGRKGQNIRLATDLTSFELDMYNYEELPAFKAKLAELRGEEVEVVEFETDEDGEMIVKGESDGEEVEVEEADKGKTKVKPKSAKKPEPKAEEVEAEPEAEAEEVAEKPAEEAADEAKEEVKEEVEEAPAEEEKKE